MPRTQWESKKRRKSPSPQISVCTEPRHFPLLRPVQVPKVWNAQAPTGVCSGILRYSFPCCSQLKVCPKSNTSVLKGYLLLEFGMTCGKVLPLCCQPAAAACWRRGKTVGSRDFSVRNHVFAHVQRKSMCKDYLRSSSTPRSGYGASSIALKLPLLPVRSTSQAL